MRNACVDNFKLGPAVQMLFKKNSILTLVAILFSGAKLFEQFLW